MFVKDVGMFLFEPDGCCVWFIFVGWWFVGYVVIILVVYEVVCVDFDLFVELFGMVWIVVFYIVICDILLFVVL